MFLIAPRIVDIYSVCKNLIFLDIYFSDECFLSHCSHLYQDNMTLHSLNDFDDVEAT